MKTTVPAKVGKKLLVLLVLIVCLLYLRPQKAAAFQNTCLLDCAKTLIACSAKCDGASTCVQECEIADDSCMAACDARIPPNGM